MSFPEEPLSLPSHKGGGYFPAMIHQKLNGNEYEIIRKLGYGPRSSTWLVLDSHNGYYYALKIFTVAASERASSVDLPILRPLRRLSVPVFHGSFWEKRGDESHLCVLMNPRSTSVRILQGETEHKRLPVHMVRKIVHAAADALGGMHSANIMHGAVKADNIFFSLDSGPLLEPILDSEPAPKTTGNKEYVTVLSQPLIHSFTPKDNMRKVVHWPLSLGNFIHAQQSTYKPEENYNYLSAPEALLRKASCSLQTDIWMLGNMAFHLLTGRALFQSKGSVSSRIATMCAVLEDKVPKEWLSDSKMKDYHAATHDPDTSIETSLSSVIHKDDAVKAAAFIKSCLRLDPKKRLTATQCTEHEWLSMFNACACCVR